MSRLVWGIYPVLLLAACSDPGEAQPGEEPQPMDSQAAASAEPTASVVTSGVSVPPAESSAEPAQTLPQPNAEPTSPPAAAPAPTPTATSTTMLPPGESPPASADCDVVVPTECPPVAPTWVEMEPLITERCVTCHYGAEGGPWPLGGHEHIVHWQVQIHDVVAGCIMPPADAEVALSKAERELILQWLACGAP